MLKITFLGAAGMVTGSRYAIHYGEKHLLVDCGLFQGPPEEVAHNYDPLPIAARDIQAVVLTHAHMDHAGALPRLYKQGFRGPILCTEPTRDLCDLMLPDSARIQESRPEEVLYTESDAHATLRLFQDHPYYKKVTVMPGVRTTFYDAGHILGSAWLDMEFDPLPGWGLDRPLRVVFSGDLGRGVAPLLMPPDIPEQADFLILESTYGDRRHSGSSARDQLSRIVRHLERDRATLVIPAFAVQRCQDLAYMFEEMLSAREIRPVDVFLDSPLAARAVPIFEDYPDYLSHQAGTRLVDTGRLLRYRYLEICETTPQSRRIADVPGPKVILSASGMAEGGRVLHHLRRYLPDPRSRVLLAGFQAPGTRGEQLQNGATHLEIDGRSVPVRARIDSLRGMSGHADQAEIDDWLSDLADPPRRTFLVHGDPPALAGQCQRLSSRGWDVEIPAYGQEFTLLGA